MATINITGIDSSGNLIMTDNGNASVSKNSVVQWVVTTQSVDCISISLPSDPPQNIWKDIPAQNGNSCKTWQGKVKNAAGSENYTISYTTPQGDNGNHDPRIQVN